MRSVEELEELSTGDRTAIQLIVSDLRANYRDRLLQASKEFNDAQRELTRKQHEVHRLERHLKRIDDFCEKNNVTTEE